MRLQKLFLERFGHFSGKTFDFGTVKPDCSDFHVIYGLNESGKTTTMEAFLRLLYAFHRHEDYAFFHGRKNLRVSVVLEIDRNPLHLSRLPLSDGSLRDKNDMQILEAVIQFHLGGLSEADYRNLLCLDDEIIEKGGNEIINSKGDIGHLLFSAAAGISDLSEVLEKFRKKAAELYRKRASTTKMAKLKRDVLAIEEQIKNNDIPASKYRTLTQALKISKDKEKTVRAERDALYKKKIALEALDAALPKMTKINSFEIELVSYENYPQSLDFNPEDLVDHLKDQACQNAEKERLTQEIINLENEMKQVERHPDNLKLLEELEPFDDLKSRYVMASLDLKKHKNTLEEFNKKMERAAYDLRVKEDTPPQTLLLSLAEISKLKTDRESLRDAMRDKKRQQKEINDRKLPLNEAEKRLKKAEAGETKAVIGPLLSCYSVDGLRPRYASAKERLQAAQDKYSQAFSLLNCNNHLFLDTLPDCPITKEEAEALNLNHSNLMREKKNLTNMKDDLQRTIEGLKKRITTLKHESRMINDKEVNAAIVKRDQLWSTHKNSLNETTAEKFESAMQAVDQITRTRLDHAKKLAQLRHEELNLHEKESYLTFDVKKIKEVNKEISDIESNITKHAKCIGFHREITPAHFSKWIANFDMAKKAGADLSRLKEKHSDLISTVNKFLDELCTALELKTDDFETAVAEARKQEEKECAVTKTRQEASTVHDGLKTEMDQRQMALKESETTTKACEKKWRDLVNTLFNETLEADTLFHSFEPLQKLRELNIEKNNTERQINEMIKDQNEFIVRFQPLRARYDVDTTLTPIEAFKLLTKRGETAHAAENRFNRLNGSLSTSQEKIKTLEIALKIISQQVQELAALFSPKIATNSLQELRVAVMATKDAIENRKNHSELVSEICTLLNVSDLDAARTKLKEKSSSDLSVDLMSVKKDLEDIDCRWQTAIEERTAADKDLRAVTGEDNVATLIGQKAAFEFEIEQTALIYLETEFGLRLAEEAISRYRDNHRSKMMKATETAFTEVTNGKYKQLETRGPKGQNKSEILLALDKDGKAKQADDMSKGTRFQLYLALRVAAYEQLAAQGVCLPFFCDDIFETFDDERTFSACRMMERIGKSGQAIYLTHHKHVVDIAKEASLSGVIVHEL
ncbi:MAG: AAA family ATPase [Alphaproteobacteria bacterium]|nr:AAA family ATPase [Alphaproteobacteria bacterium]